MRGDPLTRDEVRRLLGRRATLRWVGPMAFVGVGAALVLSPRLGVEPVQVWPVFVAYGVGLFVLYVRAVRCPRCRHNLFVRPAEADSLAFDAGHVDGGGLAPLPTHCRACGVLLGGPFAPGDDEASGGRQPAEGRPGK